MACIYRKMFPVPPRWYDFYKDHGRWSSSGLRRYNWELLAGCGILRAQLERRPREERPQEWSEEQSETYQLLQRALLAKQHEEEVVPSQEELLKFMEEEYEILDADDRAFTELEWNRQPVRHLASTGISYLRRMFFCVCAFFFTMAFAFTLLTQASQTKPDTIDCIDSTAFYTIYQPLHF